ncbi:hypothetical protein EZV62_005147 [Acer yangbiense]|uniref:Uncharacterized protein n=1 Tax=Acer yangbiense TaxID=1000413 RepID=A0A5C7IP32_9ROSI|nr:hypothetical protein EZV62_005147 [Acer yangbiense]
MECNLMKILKDIGCLSSLEVSELIGNDFESLPKSIKQLSKLRRLHLNNCSRLRSLSDLPLGLSYFEGVNCKELQSLPDANHFAESVIVSGSYLNQIEYIFTNCVKLDKKVFSDYWEESLLIKIQREKMFNCLWIIGAIFCLDYQCRLGTNIFCGDLTIGSSFAKNENLLIDLDHVMLGYHGFSDHAELFTDDYTTCSFHFIFPDWHPSSCKVKYYGVHPIYQDFGETSGSGRGGSDDHKGGRSGTNSQETL